MSDNFIKTLFTPPTDEDVYVCRFMPMRSEIKQKPDRCHQHPSGQQRTTTGQEQCVGNM